MGMEPTGFDADSQSRHKYNFNHPKKVEAPGKIRLLGYFFVKITEKIIPHFSYYAE